jgi:hypothetical protein
MSRTNAHTHREAWLYAVRDRLRPLFDEAGYPMPDNVRISCGFPGVGALGTARYRRGECWAAECSTGNVFEIFISPRVADQQTVTVILLHELVHATVGLSTGHRGPFAKAAKKLGLVAPLTTATPNDGLAAKLQLIVEEVGPYPHREMDVATETSGPKKQGTRMLKAECGECGYTVRLTKKWASIAEPLCPVDDHGAMTVEWPEGEDEEGEEE